MLRIFLLIYIFDYNSFLLRISGIIMQFDMSTIMNQVQNIQAEMERKKKELSGKIFASDTGAGMVQVKMNGEFKLIEIKISKELMNPDDLEMLQDLILGAVNKVRNEVSSAIENDMGGLTSMLPKIPGLTI